MRAVNGGAELGGTGVNERRLGGDLDGFGRRTELQRAVDGEGLVQVEGDLLARQLLESSGFELDGVGADGDGREGVVAALVGLGVIADAGGIVGNGDGGVGDHGAAGIGDAADDSTAGALGQGPESQQYRQQARQKTRCAQKRQPNLIIDPLRKATELWTRARGQQSACSDSKPCYNPARLENPFPACQAKL